MNRFGIKIKALREEADTSQRQFAIALGITPTYMSKIERGEFPPPSEAVIKKMSALLNYNSDELLAYADKIDSELIEIIKQDPKFYAKKLREEHARSKK